VIIGNTEFSSAKQSRYIASMLDKDVDGLLLASHSLTSEDVVSLERQNVPVVFLNRYDTRVAADYVGVDNQLGMHLAMSYLIEQGHRRIGYIGGRGVATAAQERLAGFRLALTLAGIPLQEDLLVAGDYSEESGRVAAAELLSRPERPTAIMCANDLMALGAMAHAVMSGLDVPGDISLAGFDDIDFAAHPRLSLTTVHYPRADSGRVAADLLFDRIERKGQPFQNIRLRPHLVVRNSVRAIEPVQSEPPIGA
jgi:LacI family transcriptional regulator